MVDHDDGDGTAPDPLIWSAGALPKRRRVGGEDRGIAIFLVLHLSGDRSGFVLFPLRLHDVGAWPCSVGLLVKFVAFLGTLCIGRGGISYVEMLLLSELWSGERVFLETAVARYRRPGRPISVLAVPYGLGIGRFMFCDIGANQCRLRHTGWERCGHGLTSSPVRQLRRCF